MEERRGETESPLLTCAECGAEAPEGAAGWRAEIAPDDQGVRAATVAVYCSPCWLREFGPVDAVDL